MNIFKALTLARRSGNLGEDTAVGLLRKSGYKIIERNYKTPDNEIDIIAEDDRHTVFVEVKTRDYDTAHGMDFESRPAASVTPKKQDELIRAAKFYLAYHKQERKGKRVRFDIIEVYLRCGKVIRAEHIENAFRQERRFYK